MIKIDDYIMDQECLELYGECDVYSPDSFDEFFEHKRLVDEIYSVHDSLFEGIFKEIGKYTLREADDIDLPGVTAAAPQSQPQDADDNWNASGTIKKSQMAPIGREKILWGNRVIKALQQVPYDAMVGVLSKTLMSTDPEKSRYIGDGFFGALKHREKTGQPLSNYTCEMRFVGKGQPKGYIFDPHTLNTVPNLGAVLSPSRAAIVQKAMRNKEPAPNPHPGYLYDGKDDDGKILFNGPGDSAGLGNSQNMAKGVFLPYKSITNEIETSVGAPMRHYSPKDRPDVKIPMRKTGKVGTSLAPPVPGQPDSYTHTMDQEGNWVQSKVPAAAGYRPLASSSNRRRHPEDQHIPEPGEGEAGLSYSTGNTGGSQTFDKQFRKWIQAQAEHPSWFNQRTANYMLYRNQQYLQGNTSYQDRSGQTVHRRQLNPLAMRPPGTPAGPMMTHAPNLDAKGNPRQRLGTRDRGTYKVPHDPSRRSIEPARRVPMSPEYREKLAKHFDEKGQHKLAARYRAGENNLPGMELGNFNRGNEKVDSGEVYDKGRRKGQSKLVSKYDTSYDDDGNAVKTVSKQKHMLPMTRRSLPHLYSLNVAIDENNPVIISEALKVELEENNKSNPGAKLRGGDTSLLGDQLVMKNYGTFIPTKKTKGVNENSNPDIKPMLFTVGAKKGNGYLVHRVSKLYGKFPCYFAKLDKHGEVMFNYTQTEADLGEHEQPILSPGILNKWMGSNPTALGGHDAAPEGSPERKAYDNEELHKNALFGNINPETGERDQNVDTYNTRTKKWSTGTSKLGWGSTIERAAKYGVDLYINKAGSDIPAELKTRMKQEEGELISLARAYIYSNLKNGKFLDVNQGTDTHFNLEYMHRLFPHLYAVMKQLDNLVLRPGKNKDGTPMSPEENAEFKRMLGSDPKHPQLPSQMTLVQFKNWMNLEGVQAILNDTGDEDSHIARRGERPEHPEDYARGRINVRMKTKYMTRFGPDGKTVYKKGYDPEQFLYQHDATGRHLSKDEYGFPMKTRSDDEMALARTGYTGLRVGVDQIWQMVNDARIWYCRWAAKDIVRKLVQSESSKSGQKLNRGGVFANSDMGLDHADAVAKEAERAERELAAGSGYTRFRGKHDALIEEKKLGPMMIQKEYGAAKQAFDANPTDMDAAVRVVQLAMRLKDSLVDLKAYRALESRCDQMEMNPDLNQPWTDENKMIYILKHLPEKIRALEQKRAKSDPGIDRELQAAHDEVMDNGDTITPDVILSKLKSAIQSYDDTNNESIMSDENYEMVGVNIASPSKHVDPGEKKTAASFALAISIGHLKDLDTGEMEEVSEKTAAAIEDAVQYHAIDTMMQTMSAGDYQPKDLLDLKNTITAFEARKALPKFCLAAKIMLSSHYTGGVK